MQFWLRKSPERRQRLQGETYPIRYRRKLNKKIKAMVLRPEAELLLCNARTDSSFQRSEQIKTLLRRDIDWDYLFQAAQRHGVVPLLYHFLDETYSELIPGTVSNQLQELCQNNTKINLFLTAELLKLLNLFEENGVPAIPYKGPALAASIYGDIALRQFVDLDILVRKRDVLKVKELLVAHGCQPELDLTPAQEKPFLDFHYDYAFLCSNKRVLVEIHWEVTEGFLSFPLDTERLWERLEPVEIAGKRVLTLSAEDSLLIVCAHSSKHLWERLGWICDVARLVESHKHIDWERVLKNAIALGGERMLLLGLYLAHDLLGTSLPESILKRSQSDALVRYLA
ncbi:MAG: nucleotidyltransferase family protein, partial [Blastocatellia bacterium]